MGALKMPLRLLPPPELSTRDMCVYSMHPPRSCTLRLRVSLLPLPCLPPQLELSIRDMFSFCMAPASATDPKLGAALLHFATKYRWGLLRRRGWQVGRLGRRCCPAWQVPSLRVHPLPHHASAPPPPPPPPRRFVRQQGPAGHV